MAQSMSALEGVQIRPYYYFEVKMTHGILSACIAYLLAAVWMGGASAVGSFPEAVGGGAGVFSQVVSDLGFASQFVFSLRAVALVSALIGGSVLVGRRKK